MEEQTLTVNPELEIQQANEVAKQIDLSEVPLLLMMSMNGQRLPVSPQNKLLKTQSSLLTDEPLSEDIKGLIFSKKDLVDILRYVTAGLLLPTDMKAIKNEMPYEAPNDSYLCSQFYSKVFIEIKNHCTTWAPIQEQILNQGIDLEIFAQNFCTNCNTIIEIIKEMPILQRMEETVNDNHITLSPVDNEIKQNLQTFLSNIKEEVKRRQNNTKKLHTLLKEFRFTLYNQITSDIELLDSHVSQINLTNARKSLEKDKLQVEKDIEITQKTYNKFVGYAFTGTTGLVLGPLGIISWAITGGIYGSKAEKVRKKLNYLKAERDRIIADITANNKMESKVATMKNRTLDLKGAIQNALTGVEHLNTIWNSVLLHIDNSKIQLDEIKDSQQLFFFQTNIINCAKSWSTIENITRNLVQLFDETLKEIKNGNK